MKRENKAFVKIVFFGTAEFSAAVLEHLVRNSRHEIVGVVSKPDTRKGRGLSLQPTPVKQMAQRLLPLVPIFQPARASAPEVVGQLKPLCADVFLIVAYGELIKQDLLQMPRLGCYNTHASLLPAYRGAAPIQRALIDGCKKTGVTIFRLTKGMDSGDMVWQKECMVDENMNAGELTERLLLLAQQGAIDVLDTLEAGRTVFTPQNHEEATLAPKISPVDMLLDSNADIVALHDRIRAFAPHPGAFFKIQYRERELRLKVLQSHIDERVAYPYRRWIVGSGGSLACATPEGMLVLDRVQLEGKAPMASAEFLRGIPLSEILFQ